jgi:hypothetical protein
MTELIDSGPISSLSRAAGNRVAGWYFPVVFGLLFAGMLFGFSETFFLRSLFRVTPIPFYLYVHGAVLTTWFALVLVQTCLIAAHRQDIHRRLGIVALAVAVVLVPLNIFVVAHVAERAHGVITPLLKLETLGDLLSLFWFSVLVSAGVYFRRQPDVHRRLMAASCFTIYGPVFARFELVFGLPIPPPAVIPLGLLVLVSYDLIVARRLKPATIWIAALWIGGLVPLLAFLGTSTADQIVRAL